jgi:hypothetical protein
MKALMPGIEAEAAHMEGNTHERLWKQHYTFVYPAFLSHLL